MSTNLECQLQLMTDGANFRDFTRSVELLIISEQVMADNNACENIYDVLSQADEF